MGINTTLCCDVCGDSIPISGVTLGGPSLPAGWAKFAEAGERDHYACFNCWTKARKSWIKPAPDIIAESPVVG